MPRPLQSPARLPLAVRAVLAWLALWRPLVPASRRATWRDQWRADLWHYWLWMTRERVPAGRAAARLFGRAWGAMPHAVSLRFNDWSLRMLLHDLRLAARLLLGRPAFTAVAILVLGLGIGANATIFSWVEAALLRPLPGVADQHRLVALRGTTPSRSDLSFSYPNFTDLRAARPAGLEDLMAFRPIAVNLRAGGDPIRAWGELVTSNFFDVLRVRPLLGRTFIAADDAAPEREPVAVLGYGLWQRVFAGDPAAIGRSVILNGRPFTIVGVTPRGFTGSAAALALEVFVPITMQKAVLSGDRLPERGNSFLQVIGRLADGASIAQAQSAASVVAARLAAEHPNANRDRGTRVVPLYRDGASGVLLPVMATLMAVVGIVLLIACANLAGLLLARASGRQREVAIRLAVGATRGRLVRQFLIESALLAGLGGLAGVVMSYWTSGMLEVFVPRTPFPVSLAAGVSPLVLGFAVVATFATAIAFGLLPALRASRPDVVSALKETTGSGVSRGARGRLRQALVVGQVALSLLLLVCAALFARSLSRAQVTDPGFSTRTGVLAALDLLPNGYDSARGSVFYAQLLQRVSDLPGVEAASVATALPLDLGSGSDMSFQVHGYAPQAGEELQTSYNRIGSGYFAAMGVEIVRGRAIDARDTDGRELAVVVNETMAARYWGGRDAIGGLVDFGNGPARVVGVARDGKYGRLNEAPRNYMYVPLAQFYRPDVTLIVRTAGDPAGLMPLLQSQVKSLDHNLPLFDVRTFEEHLRLSLFIPRLASTMLALFGALALLLAAVGLYSVIAMSVTQRTREIGIRMALGADRLAILRLVLRQGLGICAIGLALGLGLAAVAGRLLAGQLTGVSPGDPVSFVATAAVLLIVSLVASLLPAHRAATLDPLAALRRD